MITAFEKTNTRIQIGQNGFIWIDGKGEDISRAQKAIETINREASSEGLTKNRKIIGEIKWLAKQIWN